MKRKYLILFSLSGLILCCDQLTKLWVQSSLVLGERYPFGRFITLVYSTNHGFAFGALKTVPAPFGTLFYVALPAFALVLIFLIFVKLQDNQMLTSVALTTILGGALGNLIDRLRYRYVIDFIDLSFFGVRVPALNLADIFILVGLQLMLLSTLWRPDGRKKVLS